jgi:CheY-like chemotaxis protein
MKNIGRGLIRTPLLRNRTITMRKRKLPLILIADADEEERGLMRAILKLVSLDVVEAWDIRQVIKLAKEQSPDLLVINLELPSLSGNDEVERIRKESALPHLPIVAVSAKAINPRSQKSKSSTAFLLKPIKYDRFYTVIDRFLPGQMTAKARSKCLPL